MSITCHSCKKSISSDQLGATSGGPFKVLMRDSCPSCSSDLHVCLNCEFYDPAACHECRESQAEFEKHKDRANRCEYFKPSASDSSAKSSEKNAALSALDDLFKK